MIKVTKIAHLIGHKGSIYSISEGFDSNSLLSSGSDGVLAAWLPLENPDGQMIAQIPDAIYCHLLFNQKQKALLGSRSGSLHLIDLAEKREIRNLKVHAGGIFALLELESGLIISAGEDGMLLFFEPQHLAVVKSLELSSKPCRCMSVNEDESLLAVGCSDNSIRIVDLVSFKEIEKIDAHSNSVFSLIFMDNMQLLSGSRDALLKHWKLDKTGCALLNKSINAHLLHVNHLSVSPDKSYVASASMDKTIKLWQYGSLELKKVIDKPKFDAHESSVNKTYWIRDTILASCSDDRSIQVFQIEK